MLVRAWSRAGRGGRRSRRIAAGTAVLTIGGFLAFAPSAAAASGSNSFASAPKLAFSGGSSFASGDTSSATLESGETQPACATIDDSIWWAFTVTKQTTVAIDTQYS